MNREQVRRALRGAGLFMLVVAMGAGLALSWSSPLNGGVLVALILVAVAVTLIKIAEAL